MNLFTKAPFTCWAVGRRGWLQWERWGDRVEEGTGVRVGGGRRRGLQDPTGESAGLPDLVINTLGLLCTTSTPHCPHLQLAC